MSKQHADFFDNHPPKKTPGSLALAKASRRFSPALAPRPLQEGLG